MSGVNEIVHWKRQKGLFFKYPKWEQWCNQTLDLCLRPRSEATGGKSVNFTAEEKRQGKSKRIKVLFSPDDAWGQNEWMNGIAVLAHLPGPHVLTSLIPAVSLFPLPFLSFFPSLFPSFHLSIHPIFLLASSFQVAASWCLSPAVIVGEARYNLDRSQDHHRVIHIKTNEMQSFTLLPHTYVQFSVINSPNMHVYDLWQNPHMQTLKVLRSRGNPTASSPKKKKKKTALTTTPPCCPPFLSFCLNFNKVWNRGGLKRASGVFWLSFVSHAEAMWTKWHCGRGGWWWWWGGVVQQEGATVRKLKEGKLL